MGNPIQDLGVDQILKQAVAAQCALVAEHKDETTKTTQVVQQITTGVIVHPTKVAPEPDEVEPASEAVADPVAEALEEEKKAYDHQPASGELVSETPDEKIEKGVLPVPTVDEILEKMNEEDIKEDAAAEEELSKDEVLNVKSDKEVKAEAAVDENEAEEKK